MIADYTRRSDQKLIEASPSVGRNSIHVCSYQVTGICRCPWTARWSTSMDGRNPVLPVALSTVYCVISWMQQCAADPHKNYSVQSSTIVMQQFAISHTSYDISHHLPMRTQGFPVSLELHRLDMILVLTV